MLLKEPVTTLHSPTFFSFMVCIQQVQMPLYCGFISLQICPLKDTNTELNYCSATFFFFGALLLLLHLGLVQLGKPANEGITTKQLIWSVEWKFVSKKMKKSTNSIAILP